MRPLALRSILLATDLSDEAECAARAAAALSRLAGASLHLVHAGAGGSASADGVSEYLERVAPDAGPVTSARVLAGPADKVIVERARVVDADVIVLGPHRGQSSNVPLGNTASAVVRTAQTPCLTLPCPLNLPLQRVLVATDLSETSQAAVAVALSWASALRRPAREGGGTELRVLHVAREGNGTAGEALHQDVERARAEAGSSAHIDVQDKLVHDADAAAEIVHQAVSDQADLLVLGTRGGDAGLEGELGSVSAAVVRQAPCPVLLVP